MLPPLRHSLLALPPALRTSLYQQQQQRSFSASTSRKSPLSEALLYCPTLLLDTLHSTGLPWHTVIPLSAILVRSLVVYHLSALPARKAAITRANLAPLSSVRFRTEYNAYHDETINDASAAALKGEHVASRVPLMNIRLMAMKNWMNLRCTHRLGKEFGAPMFSWWRSTVNLGSLITMTEAVRVKCGAREGLLSLLIKPIDRNVDPETARRAAMTWDEIMVERLEAAYAGKQAARTTTTPQETSSSLDVTDTAGEFMSQALETTAAEHLPALNTSSYAQLADPTLRTEGLSWFTDLTLADSTLMLPLALSATMAFSVLVRPKPDALNSSMNLKNKPSPQPDMNTVSVVDALAAQPPPKSPLSTLTRSQRFGLSLSVIFFFAAAKLPVAVLLYLVPSMAFGWFQGRWLDLKYPMPAVVMPCKRPARLKVKKEFRDA